MKDNKPDVIFLVYNDHATAFSLEMIPPSPSARRRIPTADGLGPASARWSAIRRWPHIAQSVIQQDFDLTIVNKMDVDHGLTVPLSLMCGELDVNRRLALPGDSVAVNVVQYPVPSGRRCLNAGPGHPQGGGILRRRPERASGAPAASHQLQGRAPASSTEDGTTPGSTR